MKEEARISYLCTQAARYRLTKEEEAELLGYIALDKELIDLILLERMLLEDKSFP